MSVQFKVLCRAVRWALAAYCALSISACNWTELVSQNTEGELAFGASEWPSLSADGRFVAFQSAAWNLVSDDANGVTDVFVRDMRLGSTTRVSVDSLGVEGNADSEWPSLSADGRYVVFLSAASNLVPGDTNNAQDVFVHDRGTGQTRRVSVDSAGVQGNADSYFDPRISADGRYVVFASHASNLVAGDDNGQLDVFLHDRESGVTSLVSVDSFGRQGDGYSWLPDISADGRFISFASGASNLVRGDDNGVVDVFVHDRVTLETARVSVDSEGNGGDGESSYPRLSANGRYVAFHSQAANLVANDTNEYFDVFVHDRETSVTSCVSRNGAGAENDGNAELPVISADGRYVAFHSSAGNLLPGDSNGTWDVFLRDRRTGRLSRQSVASRGEQGNNHSFGAEMSSNGRYIAFHSFAYNLVDRQVNGLPHLFIRSMHDIAIDTISPDRLAIGETTTVTLTGARFVSGVMPGINGGVKLRNIVFVDEQTITFDVEVPADVQPGQADLLVTLAGDGPGAAAGVLNVCLDCMTLF